jgi:HAMP domain-containing protein
MKLPFTEGLPMMSPAELRQPVRFMSIKAKLLIVFTLLFTGFFGTLFFVFYNFAMDQAVQRMREELVDSLEAAAAGMQAEDVLQLYRQGQVNAAGFSDSQLYKDQIAWFQEVHNINPDVWLYSFVRGNRADTRRNGDPVLTNDEVIFLADLWSQYEPSKSVKFLEPYGASPQMIESLETGQLVHRPEVPLYDQWGGWITAYAPLRNAQGQIVPGVGIGADLTAEYLGKIRSGILRRMIITFAIFYILLFLLVYIVAERFTRPTINLAQAANAIGEGDYYHDLSSLPKSKVDDEITQLANVFKAMVEKVRTREFKLKQQVSELRIEIDEKRRLEEVREITDNDFFRELLEKAKTIRHRYQED